MVQSRKGGRKRTEPTPDLSQSSNSQKKKKITAEIATLSKRDRSEIDGLWNLWCCVGASSMQPRCTVDRCCHVQYGRTDALLTQYKKRSFEFGICASSKILIEPKIRLVI